MAVLVRRRTGSEVQRERRDSNARSTPSKLAGGTLAGIGLGILLVSLMSSATAAAPRGGSGGGASVLLGRGPCCVVVAEGTLWVGVHRSGRIEQIEPRSGKVLWSLAVPSQSIDYGSLVSADGALWVYGRAGNARGVMRIDPRTHKVTRVVGIPDVSGLVSLGGKLWASTRSGPFIYRMDPASATVEARLKVPGRDSYDLGVAADGALWCAAVNDGQTSSGAPNSITVRISPAGKIVESLQPFGPGPYGALAEVQSIASVGNAIWETQADDGSQPGVSATLLRIDAKTGRVTLKKRPRIQGYRGAFPVVRATSDGALWLQTGPAALQRIDPTTGKVLRRVSIPLGDKRPRSDHWSSAIAAGLGSYWITTWPGISASSPADGKLVRVAAP
jgi:streptogramin lyase